MIKIATLESSSRLAVTYRPVGDLIPDPRNERTHPKREIDHIRTSIEAFGFTNPILADPEGHIIAGNGRLQAARLMGLAELPVITLSGLSETQKRTLRIADNFMATDRAGRRFRGLDIDPAYVDVAIERWSARTGLKPHLEGPASIVHLT